MPLANLDLEVDLDTEVDISAELPCEGISYTHPNGELFAEPCLNPGEWTRPGHCSPDPIYCSPCKEEISSMAVWGWVVCAECNTKVWPEQLQWRRL